MRIGKFCSIVPTNDLRYVQCNTGRDLLHSGLRYMFLEQEIAVVPIGFERLPLVGQDAADGWLSAKPIDLCTGNYDESCLELELTRLLALVQGEIDSAIVIFPVDGLLQPSIRPGRSWLEIKQMCPY